MSRERRIHPQIWNSDDFSKLSFFSRLVFVGTFSTADDAGRRRGTARSVKGDLFPQDEAVNMFPPGTVSINPSTANLVELVELALAEIDRVGRGTSLARRYSANGEEVVDHPNWSSYQNPRWKKESLLPAYEDRDVPPETAGGSPRTAADLTTNSPPGRGGEGSGGVGTGREGSGGEGPGGGPATPGGGEPAPRRRETHGFTNLQDEKGKDARAAIAAMQRRVPRSPEGRRR